MSTFRNIDPVGDGRRYGMMDKPDIIMTRESNAPILAVCHSRGWCASPEFMTRREAEKVTDLTGYPFRSNQDITHFDEFRFFTGIRDLPLQLFYNCKNLQYTTLPKSLARISGNSSIRFEPSNTPHRVIVPTSLSVSGSYVMYNWGYGDTAERIIVFVSPIPPTLGSETSLAPGDGSKVKIFVPDVAVSEYQALSNLREGYLDNIYPLSQCPAEHLEYHDLIGGKVQI